MAVSVSLLVPTKNRAPLLKRCLDSCIAQTHQCEIIVFDGGSTDNTQEVAESYGDKIKYYRLNDDPGMIATWYNALALSHGDWIHFALDDDWMDPTFISECVRRVGPDVGAVITQASIEFPDGRTQLNLSDGIIDGSYISSSFLMWFESNPLTISPSCAMLRREDALDWLTPARIIGTSCRYKQNDCGMMIGAIASHPIVEYISRPLVHFGAQESGLTMTELKDKISAKKYIEGYSDIKRAMFSAISFNH